MSTEVTFNGAAQAVLRKYADRLQGRQINPVIGQAASNATRDHLARLEAEHQRPADFADARPTHFYAQCARSVHYTLQPSSVTVGIAHVGAAQRYYGGTIRPVKAGALTIPACAAAYGRRAREFNDLVLVMLNGKPALVEAERTEIRVSKRTGKVKRKAERGGKVMFWLVPYVTQRPNPDMLPKPTAYRDAITEGVESYLLAQGT